MGRKANDRAHGRGKHRPPGGCATGRKVYRTKNEAGDDGERCDRCKFWHAADDRPRRRR